ncbi:hypothetical protein JCM10213_000161 [Rhodosporidiobolus nylandii]
MQAALSALHSSRSQAPQGAQQAGAAMQTPSGHALPDLDPLRLRLVKLIDALSGLHSQLEFLRYSTPTPSSAAPGVLPFPELVARYNLLLTHLTAVQGLLSSQQEKEKEQEREREEGAQAGSRRNRKDKDRDLKRERWDAVSVVPAVEVDEAKDWLVGMLLRTKQTPDVETSQATLTSTLPEPFSSALSTSTASSNPDAFLSVLTSHASLITSAYDRLSALKEFNSENEEWDWKARVDLEEQEHEAEADAEDAEMKSAQEQQEDEGGKRPWTAKETQVFLRTGRRPEV